MPRMCRCSFSAVTTSASCAGQPCGHGGSGADDREGGGFEEVAGGFKFPEEPLVAGVGDLWAGPEHRWLMVGAPTA